MLAGELWLQSSQHYGPSSPFQKAAFTMARRGELVAPFSSHICVTGVLTACSVKNCVLTTTRQCLNMLSGPLIGQGPLWPEAAVALVWAVNLRISAGSHNSRQHHNVTPCRTAVAGADCIPAISPSQNPKPRISTTELLCRTTGRRTEPVSWETGQCLRSGNCTAKHLPQTSLQPPPAKG